jgi:hypothetical protein
VLAPGHNPAAHIERFGRHLELFLEILIAGVHSAHRCCLSLGRHAERKSESGTAWQVLGAVHHEAGEYQAAPEALEEAAIQPGDVGAMFVLSKVHFRGQTDLLVTILG